MTYLHRRSEGMHRFGLIVRRYGVWLTLGPNFLQLSWGSL